MKYISNFFKKLWHLRSDNFPQNSSSKKIPCLANKPSIISFYFGFIVTHTNPFWLHISYFLVTTMFGYLALKQSKPITDHIIDDFDLFFTSASATTVASLSTVEMEIFSNTQLIIMTILIFLGGEIFISFLTLLFRRSKLISSFLHKNRGNLSTVDQDFVVRNHDETNLRHKSIKLLGYVVTGYIFLGHVLGVILVSVYISFTTTAKNVLENKGLVIKTFSIFTTVSTFANCGFIPTNENMIVFRNNPGLLLILIPFGLLGGTLYPPCLRFVLWVMERFSKKKEYTYLLKNYEELNYGHLMSTKECWLLVGTVFWFLVLQFVMFCLMEWNSGALKEMSAYEKIVGTLFQTVNVRHAGESVVDLSCVSSAILVIFIVMMYFPPYTSFLPIGYQQQLKESESFNKCSIKSNNKTIQNIVFSQLSYLTIFVILLCITERKKLKDDPLNFNLLNIVFEVISGYGSVGFSTGYSCERRLTYDEICIDKSYGLAGRFSKAGKFTLILVMFCGRLKKFNMHGGKAWRVS